MRDIVKTIKYVQFNSGLARYLLGYYFREGNSYRVPFGPLKGHKLYYDRSVNYHAILGLWDVEGFNTLRRALSEMSLLHEESVFVDVGSNIGLVSLWLSHLLRGEGKIYSFEPAPQPAAIQAHNLSLNRAMNVERIGMACSDKVG